MLAALSSVSAGETMIDITPDSSAEATSNGLSPAPASGPAQAASGPTPFVTAVVLDGADKATEAYLAKNPGAVSFCALRLSDGAVLAAAQPRRPMLPASVQKLCTTAVALEKLGNDFKFTTTVALLGGDLVVVGDGDPTLGDPVLARAAGRTIYDALDSWAAAVKALGVAQINDLVLDESIFPQRRPADWPANQRGRWYCAPVSGLNFNNNCLDVLLSVQQGQVSVELSPQSQLIAVDNRLAMGNKHLWHVALSDDVSSIRLTGMVRQSSRATFDPANVAVEEPALLLGRVLADRLARAGVTVKNQIVLRQVRRTDGSLPPELTVIARQADPLAAALRRMNKNSLNMAAECVFLRAAADPAAADAYASAAVEAKKVLQERFGLPADEFVISDGCGLSRQDRLSPMACTLLLRQLARGRHAGAFLPTLAVAGVDGSLSKRLGRCAGRFIGKTGTVSGVSTLAGYLLDQDGRPIVAAAVFCGDPPGGIARARQVQDALITRWIVEYAQSPKGSAGK
jgi:serine-type D-Ala-D-Ala carboxypeptidase/endopeptidase (penicillin-binding protein 4)